MPQMLTLPFPRSDSGLLVWSQNFFDHIQADPTSYNLTAADATNYGTVHDSYSASVAACDPSVRSKPAVTTKKAAATLLKNTAALLATKIYSSSAVTDTQKVELGIPPRATPTPRPAPTTAPVLQVVSAIGWTVIIRLRDASGARRGKPAGVVGASVFSYVGETAPADISAWHFEGSAGRVAKIEIAFPTTLAAGSKVWLCSFWFNARKESGPLCQAYGVNLPGGTVQLAE